MCEDHNKVETVGQVFVGIEAVTHRIKLQEELIRLGLCFLRVGLHLHHGVEVLRPFQRRLCPVLPLGTHWDEKLGPTGLFGHLEKGQEIILEAARSVTQACLQLLGTWGKTQYLLMVKKG